MTYRLPVDPVHEIDPRIYSWCTPDVSKYVGWEKIGYTIRDADVRIAEQASQLRIAKEKLWDRPARYADGESFRDSDFHRFLTQHGVEREPGLDEGKRPSEWFHIAATERHSLDYFAEFINHDYSGAQGGGTDAYALRGEQCEAVEMALTAMSEGVDEVLWNAKPRFGKTLSAYELAIRMDARRVLIVTNRPTIATSWFDDFERFVAHQTSYKFVSESPSLAERSPLSRSDWRKWLSTEPADPRIVEFVSLQDLKGSKYFGGAFDKLRHIVDAQWDLLIIDESHEGVDTLKTDVAFTEIKRSFTLHLSGTPFKAIAKGAFGKGQIYNWSYEDEQGAKAGWDEADGENPYQDLPTLNLLTYQLSPMIFEVLDRGAVLEEDASNVDYTFDLSEFFSTKADGSFTYATDVERFLDTLTKNRKYPFSTPELRGEIRHSLWLLDRVDSARALKRMLEKHPVFEHYDVVLAAGDGRVDDSDPGTQGKSLALVRAAIAKAERNGARTITLSVGQLTTGVTVPEWTAVMMLSNMASASQYMQAAFRSQNPWTFVRDGKVYAKQNAYIVDFAPERSLVIFDEFANNLRADAPGTSEGRQEVVRRLLNFLPILGEDTDGEMVALDAAQVLTLPKVFKAREVVRRGFMSNLLFANIGGIFRYPDEYKEILDRLPTAKQGRTEQGAEFTTPEPPLSLDEDGNVAIGEWVISAKVRNLGTPVIRFEYEPPATVVDGVNAKSTDDVTRDVARDIAARVAEQTEALRFALAGEYGLSEAVRERDAKRTESQIEVQVKRALTEYKIELAHADDARAAATPEERDEAERRRASLEAALVAKFDKVANEVAANVPREIVQREETRKEQKRANQAKEDARSHLRGFSRTIPMFLMAYGTRETTLANFDEYTPDDVFLEITGISEADFRKLRDGWTVQEQDGSQTQVPGLFDVAVFDQAVQEFLDKKAALADYFDETLTEDIFAYIPNQKTSLVFTPQRVVKMMVDILEEENPGIFIDSTTSLADLYSKAGMFLMEVVRRLDKGLTRRIPDRHQRLEHILRNQVFAISPSEMMRAITLEAVSGGDAERKGWLTDSEHFRVGNLALMAPEERQSIIEDMLTEGAKS